MKPAWLYPARARLPGHHCPDLGDASVPGPPLMGEQDAVQAPGREKPQGAKGNSLTGHRKSGSFQQSRNCPPKLCLTYRLSENAGIGISSPQNVAGSSLAGLQLPSAPHSRLRENSLCTEHPKGINPPGAQNRTFPPLAALCSLPPFHTFRHREYVFLIIQISKELSMQHFLFPQERSNRCTNTDTEENALEIHLPGEANQNYIDHKRRNYALGLSISAHLNSLCTAGMA